MRPVLSVEEPQGASPEPNPDPLEFQMEKGTPRREETSPPSESPDLSIYRRVTGQDWSSDTLELIRSQLREPTDGRSFTIALWAAGECPLPQALDWLMALAGETSTERKAEVLRRIAESSDPRALSFLLGEAEADDPGRRECAAVAILERAHSDAKYRIHEARLRADSRFAEASQWVLPSDVYMSMVRSEQH